MDNDIKSCLTCKAISPACKKLNKAQLTELSKNCVAGEIKKGDTILKQGALTSYAIYLREGLVKESMSSHGMREQIFNILTTHSYLGISSLFGNELNHFSYTALCELKICYINRVVLENLIKENGEFAYEIMVSLCSDNLRGSDKLFNQSQKKIYGRVADAILYFSDDIFEKREFALPLNRREIANLIGTSRESTTRALIKFHDEKVIKLDRKKLKILNYDQLLNISKTG